MFIALVTRLLAAVFSKGFAFYDDHFLIIDVADMWVNKIELWYEHVGHRFTYQFAHYLLFHLLNFLSVDDPQAKMLVVRILHAVYSTIMIYYAYKLVRELHSEEMAKRAGLLLALFWLFPFMSVRNLGEFVCVVPLLAGFYYLHTAEDNRFLILTGVLFAFAISFRFQLVFLFAGLVLVLAYQRHWKLILTVFTSSLITLFLIQGIPDIISDGYPFESFFGTVNYNVDHATDYLTGPWYRYILLIFGILIPPSSFILIYGFFKSSRFTYIFWPTVFFIVMHSLFPNKQERFMLPVLPFILILSVIGFEEIRQSETGKRFRRLLSSSMGWFYSVNLLLLVIFTFTYSKKSRVESLAYLSQKTDISALIIERDEDKVPRPPLFYLNQREVPVYELGKSDTVENKNANYIIFLGEKNLDNRVQKIESVLGKNLELKQIIGASLIDQIVYWLNPKHNINETSYIYKTGS
ncbi:MAG: glycosyltransferase family 39 protein [Calditrichaeota bacterium]|nr:glycosyltransferase family 39 protein [Calditrichota bacterium]